jgi:hypothetical protein
LGASLIAGGVGWAILNRIRTLEPNEGEA